MKGLHLRGMKDGSQGRTRTCDGSKAGQCLDLCWVTDYL